MLDLPALPHIEREGGYPFGPMLPAEEDLHTVGDRAEGADGEVGPRLAFVPRIDAQTAVRPATDGRVPGVCGVQHVRAPEELLRRRGVAGSQKSPCREAAHRRARISLVDECIALARKVVPLLDQAADRGDALQQALHSLHK